MTILNAIAQEVLNQLLPILQQHAETITKALSAVEARLGNIETKLSSLEFSKPQQPIPPQLPRKATSASTSSSITTRKMVHPSTVDSNPDVPDVFISLHVGSCLKMASEMKAQLEERGFKVWLCTKMDGGESYRDQIAGAVEKTIVVIPLINSYWAESGECEDEFNHARRQNLTSHQRGRTSHPEPRQPIIFPFFLPGLDFNKYTHIRLLASSVNFLPLDPNNITDAVNRLVASISRLHPKGLSVQLGEVESKPAEMEAHREVPAALTNTVENAVTKSGGTFILRGQTVNDYDGNLTTTDRCLLTFTSDGHVKGTIDYKAGTIYNSSDIANVDGTVNWETRRTEWIEEFSAKSHFKYRGVVDKDGKSIKGDYYWIEKPAATGKFEFHVERWL
ncbi:UNVERIFIED_CONTAM: hypothetical protein HDU68_004041 [Siphonaria sp. JEL0065]|nr:hypothetical protein HDU68_004041 [Siphonaria sp. JEL0065]